MLSSTGGSYCIRPMHDVPRLLLLSALYPQVISFFPPSSVTQDCGAFKTEKSIGASQGLPVIESFARHLVGYKCTDGDTL